MTDKTRLDALTAALPKAELHLHIEGSLEPELMFALAKRNGVTLRFADVEAVRAAYAFSDLQSFLDIYYEGAGVLRTQADFHDLAWAYLGRVARDGARHVEIFFDPQTHTARGIPMGTVVEGLLSAFEKGERELGISWRLIPCFLRHLDEDDAFATLAALEPWIARFAAIGLDSSEKGHPPSKFARVFAKARALGLQAVAHAGEEGPPAYILEALDLLQARRIDHGVRCVEDDALVGRLRREAVPLTVCPLSNVKLRVFDRLEDHNLKRLLDLGLVVTINADDPAYFGGYLLDNWLATARALDLSAEDLVRLARNSFAASFLAPADKARHLAEIDAVAARFGVECAN
ncbi:MAG: adenosine deaminase [Tagaea sp.]|nr:adenosine deaminase [Tagaea sp.]